MSKFSARFKTRSIFVLFVCSIGLSLSQGAAAERQTLKDHVPKVLAGAAPVSPVPDDYLLHLIIGLPLRAPGELENLLHDLYDPQSPFFRRFLSPEEFTARFGPTPEDYQAVIDFAQRSGLVVEGT